MKKTKTSFQRSGQLGNKKANTRSGIFGNNRMQGGCQPVTLQTCITLTERDVTAGEHKLAGSPRSKLHCTHIMTILLSKCHCPLAIRLLETSCAGGPDKKRSHWLSTGIQSQSCDRAPQRLQQGFVAEALNSDITRTCHLY